MTDHLPILLIILLGFIATEPWRWLGVALTSNMDEDHEVIKWARAVSTALIAALVVRLLVSPPEDLAVMPLWLRFAALAASTGFYFAVGRRILPAIAGGVALFLILANFT